MRHTPRPSIVRPVVKRRRPILPTEDEKAQAKEMKAKQAADNRVIQDWLDTMNGIAFAKSRPNWIVISTREAQAYLDSL